MSENVNVRFQKKPISNRTLIMNIDESDIQSHEERSFVQKYKQICQQLEATDAPWYEQQLRNLEEKEIFKTLVDRERQKLQIQREMAGRLALEAWRENDRKKVQENISSIQKRREENLQSQAVQSEKDEKQEEPPTRERSWWLYLIPIGLFALVLFGFGFYGIFEFFEKVWEYSNESIGKTILNILLIPFAVFGGLNLIRGFFTILDTDVKKLGIQKYWIFVLYFFINVVGFFAFFSFCLMAM